MKTIVIFVLYFLFSVNNFVNSLPVDTNKSVKSEEKLSEERVEKKLDEYGLEYGRYLQQVAALLEEDQEFAKRLENVSYEHIRSGKIARELNFVNHNIRNKLDELKRIEMDRLRQLTKKEHDLKERTGGSYSLDGRRWRTVGSSVSKNENFADHIDHDNPDTFEVEDLHKLIVKATKDLEDLDQKRREEFKQYEMEKELQYQESLKNMTEDQRKEVIKAHDEKQQKHKDHPRVHHPGSKAQLEEVWEEKDHLPKEEFNPKVFFAMHDINNDGYLDQEEVEALFNTEIKKMYDPNNPEDDPQEMQEEYHRMREHIYSEADKDRDGLISKKEFIELTQKADFEKDNGWEGIGEKRQGEFSNDDLQNYKQHREELLQHQYGYYVQDPYQAHQNVPYVGYDGQLHPAAFGQQPGQVPYGTYNQHPPPINYGQPNNAYNQHPNQLGNGLPIPQHQQPHPGFVPQQPQQHHAQPPQYQTFGQPQHAAAYGQPQHPNVQQPGQLRQGNQAQAAQIPSHIPGQPQQYGKQPHLQGSPPLNAVNTRNQQGVQSDQNRAGSPQNQLPKVSV